MIELKKMFSKYGTLQLFKNGFPFWEKWGWDFYPMD
jgi:hypothetical protein